MLVSDVLEFFDTKQQIAKAIGISESAVYQWGTEVPRSRRESVRLAMRDRAERLERVAARLRATESE